MICDACDAYLLIGRTRVTLEIGRSVISVTDGIAKAMKAQLSPPANRAVVTWEGPGEPIMLTIYGTDGEVVAVPLEPKRALTLAQEPA